MTTLRNPLQPDRHPQRDFFLCDLSDVVSKSDQGSMEHPLFSLSSKKDMKPATYVNGDKWLKVIPQGELGRATIHDRAILLYIISQCIAYQNSGYIIDRSNRKIRVNAYNMLVETNRSTSGRGYKLLENTFSRLQGTQIQTNITQGGGEKMEIFSLVDKVSMLRGSENTRTRDGKMFDVEVTLSDWLFDAIDNNYVLTIHRDYFRLRKPIERRLYEIARKHCGKQSKWEIGLTKLKDKTGSLSTDREFKRMLVKIINDNLTHSHIPDYSFIIDDDKMVVRPIRSAAISGKTIQLKPDTYEEARLHASGWDIRMLENEWRDWVAAKNIKVRNPDSNFISFCKKRGSYKNEELF